MDWVRVKTILIIVFLVVNIFLLTKIIDKGSTAEMTQDELQNLKQLLTANGITFQTEMPARFEYMRRINVTDGTEGGALANILFGTGSWTLTNRQEGEAVYVLGERELKVRTDGRFSYTTRIKPVDNKHMLDIEQTKEQVLGVLGTYTQTENYEVTSVSTMPEGYALDINFFYLGNEVFNNSARVEVFNSGQMVISQGLINLTGFTGKPEKVTPIDALVKLIETTGGQTTVKEMVLGYYADLDKEGEIVKYGKAKADPAWKVETDKGIFIFDGYNGSLLYKEDAAKQAN